MECLVLALRLLALLLLGLTLEGVHGCVRFPGDADAGDTNTGSGHVDGEVNGAGPKKGTYMCVTKQNVIMKTTACGDTDIRVSKGGNCFKFKGLTKTCSIKGVKVNYYVVDYHGKDRMIGKAYLTGSTDDQFGANGKSMCITGSGVTVRKSDCSISTTQVSTPKCYTSKGENMICVIKQKPYNMHKLDLDGEDGWVASNYLAMEGTGSSGISNDCLKCICEIESNCNANLDCKMDVGSLSCGPYQIKEPYYKDCYKPGTDWKSCTTGSDALGCSETCVKSYMTRYGKHCTGKTNPTCEEYARIHNGGPAGCKSSATVKYWTKISTCCKGKNC